MVDSFANGSLIRSVSYYIKYVIFLLYGLQSLNKKWIFISLSIALYSSCLQAQSLHGINTYAYHNCKCHQQMSLDVMLGCAWQSTTIYYAIVINNIFKTLIDDTPCGD